MVIDRVREALRGWRDRRRLVRSPLFDAAWYRANHPDVPAHVDAARHFLTVGAARGHHPHPLFDTAWYLERNPDVADARINPLLHYLLEGGFQGRDPNPYFASAWYLASNSDVGKGGANPLAHYVAHGAREGRRPSPLFDPAFYRQHLPEDDPAREAPLAHFLTAGRAQGLAVAAMVEGVEGEPVEQAALDVRKPWAGQAGRQVALFVTHSADGRLKPHVAHHARALHAAGVEVVLIVAADAGFWDEVGPLPLAGLYVRENIGFDFAAWAHLLKLELRLWDSETLLLVNDSVIGPFGADATPRLLQRVRDSEADLVGLTESREGAWHVQSYFLALKASALRNPRLQRVFLGVRGLADKAEVVRRYEVGLSGVATEAGLKVEALFGVGAQDNPTLFAWRALIAEGFPFLKASVPAGRHADVSSEGWREELSARGFDLSLAEPLLRPAGLRPSAAGCGAPAPALTRRSGSLAFYGPWNYANGLGEASRGYLRALARLEGPVNRHALKRPFHVHRRLFRGYDVRDFVGPADAAVVHLNPDGWHLLTAGQRREIDRASRRIGLWVWEMDRLPEAFRADLGEVDAIWTPSRYCAEVFSAATSAPVHVVPHVVVPPSLEEREDARRLDRMILYVFDSSSYLVRKNPLALVEAFVEAGLHALGWRLVLKTKNLGEAAEEGAELAEACRRSPGVELIDRALGRGEMADLFGRADIYASPHAAEGFGLTIAEAMAAGKIVVATDYSGPRDFLDESCGFPVAYDLVPLGRSHGHYEAGGRWAAVRVDALARALSQAAGRLEAGDRTLAVAARARIAERLSADAVAHAMREGLDRLAAGDSPAPSGAT